MRTLCTAEALLCPSWYHQKHQEITRLSPAVLQLPISPQGFSYLSYTVSKVDRSTKPRQHIPKMIPCVYFSPFPTLRWACKWRNQCVSLLHFHTTNPWWDWAHYAMTLRSMQNVVAMAHKGTQAFDWSSNQHAEVQHQSLSTVPLTPRDVEQNCSIFPTETTTSKPHWSPLPMRFNMWMDCDTV